MKHRSLLLSVIILLISLLSFEVRAQNILPQPKQEEQVQPQTDSVEIVAFPSTGITEAFGATGTMLAADLEKELFAEWPERLDLVTELTGTILIPEKDEQRQKSRATAYDDLAGQLRLTLDQFTIKRRFGFSLLSLMLMALIAAIGPLDFLLINRLLGRPSALL